MLFKAFFSTSEQFTRSKVKIQIFKEKDIQDIFIKIRFSMTLVIEILKIYQQAAYINIIASGNKLHDETFDIAKDSNYKGYTRGLASTVYNFFNKRSAITSGAATENEIILN